MSGTARNVQFTAVFEAAHSGKQAGCEVCSTLFNDTESAAAV
jgi:hypothetical protein